MDEKTFWGLAILLILCLAVLRFLRWLVAPSNRTGGSAEGAKCRYCLGMGATAYMRTGPVTCWSCQGSGVDQGRR
jgi:hypothetical protein